SRLRDEYGARAPRTPHHAPHPAPRTPHAAPHPAPRTPHPAPRTPHPAPMRPFTSVIPLDEARRRLHETVHPIERTERVALDEAGGRVAAVDVASGIAVPPFARSAMDGYAVVAADTAGASRTSPVRLRIVERIF